MYSGCPGSTAWLCFEKPAEPLADSSVPSPCCCQGVGALPWFAGGLKPMQLYGAMCPRPIFAEVMEETRCATLVGSLNTVCDVWVVSRESSVNHIGVDVGSLAPSYDTISFDSLSSQQLRGAGLYPLPQGGILHPCQCTQQLFQCHHRASLEHRYPSLEMLPSKPAGCPGWLGPVKPSCCCPSLLPGHGRQLWFLFQIQALCTLTLDSPHSPKLALEYITGGKATLKLLVCDGLFSSIKSLQVPKSF